MTGHYAEAKGINKQGLKRRGFSDGEIAALQTTFKRLVKRKGVKSQEAYEEVGKLAEEFPKVAELINFLKEGNRGTVG